MRQTLKNRTWPVFVAGLGSLLLLLFLPGVTALRRSDEIYHEIRQIQAAQQATQRSLAEIERRLYLISIAVREALLDTSPVQGTEYRATVVEGRAAIETELRALRQRATGVSPDAFLPLQSELERYWTSITPVFQWTPDERAAKATYFLREQQRPRRQSILAIARSVGDLTARSYQNQYENVNSSQREFREDIERIVAVAFLLGTIIAGASIYRTFVLENRSARERQRSDIAEEQLRALSTQLMHAQEQERKAISRELHDEVGQMLTGLRMQLTALERSREDADMFATHVAEAKTLAEQTLRSVRDLAVGLRPSVLDLGLVPALQWQARHFSRLTNIRVSVQVEGKPDEVPEDLRTCVYRVVQESLTNAVRHAAATAVNVQLSHKADGLHVAIQDDGSGFKVTNGRLHGLGLLGMEERVRELGGRFRVDSTPGRGTIVHVDLSLPSQSAV